MMKYILWLQLVMGFANSRAIKALEYFGSAEKIFSSDIDGLRKAKIFTKKDLEKIISTPLSSAEKIIVECNKSGIDILPYGSEKYPKKLMDITDPPLVLYIKGKLPDFDTVPSICIVGPRRVSDFGKKSAYSLAFRLASAGMTIVSGGALGSDTYAHAGALKANGTTVLIMGCGINYNYLPENRRLRDKIVKDGCLISEFPPNYPASKFNFPIRNRLMSALSLGTIVIEAKKRSGALITANHAIEQGRDVFVIPNSPLLKEYEGSNALLRDGAIPLLSALDVLNEYIPTFPDKIDIVKAFENNNIINKKPKEQKNEKNSLKTLSKEAKIVYNCLDKQKFIPDEIKNIELSSSQLLAALVELEIEGIIRALPGGAYEKIE